MAPPPLAGKTRPGAEARRAYEETRVRGMRRVAAKTPVATSTTPSSAAAPIAKSPHTNPFSATVTAGGVLATTCAPPRPYFAFSALLRRTSARCSCQPIAAG